MHLDKEATTTDNAMIGHEALVDAIKSTPRRGETGREVRRAPAGAHHGRQQDGPSQVGGFKVSPATYMAVSAWCQESKQRPVQVPQLPRKGAERFILHINWESHTTLELWQRTTANTAEFEGGQT